MVNVAAVTLPVNVPVEQLVTVTVPISVPIAPETPMVLVVLKVISEAVLPAVPATDDNETGVAAPAPTVRVTPSAKVMAPIVIVPVEVLPTVEVPVTDTGLFRLMTPVPAAVTVPYNVMAEGAMAVMPPVKLSVSEPLPKVRVPVFANVVAPAMVLLEPVMDTL